MSRMTEHDRLGSVLRHSTQRAFDSRWGRWVARKPYRVVRNANRVKQREYDRSALLVHLVTAFLVDESHPRFFKNQDFRRSRQMAEVLGELGYVVDVVHKRDRAFRPARDYDLVISDRPDWGDVERLFGPAAPRIFLAASMNHATHNRNLRRRHDWLFERRGRSLELRRIYGETAPALTTSDALTGPGNGFTMGTWNEVFDGPTYPFDNIGLRGTVFSPGRKDYSSARRHFLYFASRSQVQKGLDLLLEVFPKLPHLHLYICSNFETELDFCDCYRRELFETPNIHPIGWIRVNGSQYEQLVDRCGFVIHPTCSEGQAGSVVQCMHSGLVPLVTREAGIAAEDAGAVFADDSLEEIERVVTAMSEQPEDWLQECSERTHRVAVDRYSEEAFVQRWRQIVTEVTSGSPAGSPRSRGGCEGSRRTPC